jgi:hypothetical protein
MIVNLPTTPEPLASRSLARSLLGKGGSPR